MTGDAKSSELFGEVDGLVERSIWQQIPAARITTCSRRQVARLIARGQLQPAGPRRDRTARAALHHFMAGGRRAS